MNFNCLEKNIDGLSLLNLTDSMIQRMISRQSSNDQQNTEIIERFKYKLNELKMEQNSTVTKRIQYFINSITKL